MTEVGREINCSHAARADFTLEAVLAGKVFG